MDLWPLPIFPDGSLASSVITTVWVGVFVVCLFNLRFGWVLSGLVVPGYLVPLLIAKPVSAFVVMVEASLAYAIFWFLSERLSGPTRWSSFFGRDRFMGLILVSAALRLLLDGLLLPILANRLASSYGWQLDWENNLHAFGLIVVALWANQLWKPGYVRGMAQALVMIGVTFLVIRFGLMELTNFRIAAVIYLYEDFASSVFASPKAYIILIITCFVASRMNLRYGWDFSGIMIPALLALQWYQPWKILTSFVEALIIYFAASAALSSRLFASATIEGGRKILLFFNISFAYKLLLGHGLALWGVEHRITDYYGFGYLLPTLIAIKAHDKDILARVTRATAQISLTGALAGSLIGFALSFLLPVRGDMALSASTGLASVPTSTSARVAAKASGDARLAAASGQSFTLQPADVATFRAAISRIDAGGATPEAEALLRQVGLILQRLAGGRLAIVPADQAGLSLLFDPAARQAITFHVPRPQSAPGLSLAGHALFERQGARWLVLGESEVIRQGGQGISALPEFKRAAPYPLVQVVAAAEGASELRLVEPGGSQLDLAKVRGALPDLKVDFAPLESQASVIALDRRSIWRLVGSVPTPSAAMPPKTFEQDEMAFVRYDLLDPLLAREAAWPGLVNAAAAIGLEVGRTTSAGRGLTVLRPVGGRGQLYLVRPEGSGPILQLAAEDMLQPLAAHLFARLDARAMLVVPERSWLDGEEAQMVPLLTHALLSRKTELSGVTQLRRRPRYAPAGSPLLAVDRIQPDHRLAGVLLRSLSRAGVDARLMDRGPTTSGLEVNPPAYLRYLQQSRGSYAAILWLESPQ